MLGGTVYQLDEEINHVFELLWLFEGQCRHAYTSSVLALQPPSQVAAQDGARVTAMH